MIWWNHELIRSHLIHLDTIIIMLFRSSSIFVIVFIISSKSIKVNGKVKDTCPSGLIYWISFFHCALNLPRTQDTQDASHHQD